MTEHRDATPRIQFGIDVSEHQDGISLIQAAREGIEFVIVRTTDGTYRDRTYRSHIDDALAAALPAQAYHYLRNPSEGTSISEQVDSAVDVMGGAGGRWVRPVWLDCETPAGLALEHVREARDRFNEHGVEVPGIYTYPRYWRWRMRGADTREFGAVWVAQYGQDVPGGPAAIFPGGWPAAVGTQTPLMWQFGSRGRVAGFEVDVNARRV